MIRNSENCNSHINNSVFCCRLRLCRIQSNTDCENFTRPAVSHIPYTSYSVAYKLSSYVKIRVINILNISLQNFIKKYNLTIIPITKSTVSVNCIEVSTLFSGKVTHMTSTLNEYPIVNGLKLIHLELYDAVMLINSHFRNPVLLKIISMTTTLSDIILSEN